LGARTKIILDNQRRAICRSVRVRRSNFVTRMCPARPDLALNGIADLYDHDCELARKAER